MKMILPDSIRPGAVVRPMTARAVWLFPDPGLAHQSHRFTLPDIQVDPVDGAYDPAAGVEVDPQVLDVQYRSAARRGARLSHISFT